MTKLGVNIDHVATLREARKGTSPDPVYAALLSEMAGADSIVAHLREDRRHIKERDVILLKQTIKTRLNLEMSTYEDIVKFACRVKPQRATLVPEKRQELTTEGGLNVINNFKKVSSVIKRLKKQGIEVSLFINPDKKQIHASREAGVDIIELHTGNYANAKNTKEQHFFLKELEIATCLAREKGLRVCAGHGLDYHNAREVAKIKEIEELNIGYSIICRAVITGLNEAVSGMKKLISYP